MAIKLIDTLDNSIFVRVLGEAVRDGSIGSLVGRLEYLNNWGDDHRTNVRVNLFPQDAGYIGLMFLREDGSNWMNGGLVKHDRDWGVHT